MAWWNLGKGMLLMKFSNFKIFAVDVPSQKTGDHCGELSSTSKREAEAVTSQGKYS
jgi:hypothetical protein